MNPENNLDRLATEIGIEMRRAKRGGWKLTYDEAFDAICFRHDLAASPEMRSTLGKILSPAGRKRQPKRKTTALRFSPEELKAWAEDFDAALEKRFFH